ncbi:MAG TPA: glutamate--tRNA ligase [Patescibacteria group bacterium]|nr:glutamate--tRNA ligase [Patescibacteria group bacterium]
MKVRTRFAPSPTGNLHIGGLRSALYPYALAKRNGGDFILRIEDTDKKREVLGSKEKIGENLKLFGISWDEYYVQSERLDIYKKAAEKLIKEGHAFYCDCKARNAKTEGFTKILRDPCRDKNKTSGAIKLKVPENETVSYHDLVLDKNISWDTNDVQDATLLKSDGYPTYHLAAMTDDLEMKITHVLRGHDWMPSTPIHLLVYKYLGGQMPELGHLTDILDPEGGKLSKRKGSTSVEGLIAEGYLPGAILNFIMLLGWAPKDNKELFTLEEFVKAFDVKGLQKSNPVFNREKLDWFNGQYIRQFSDDELKIKLQIQNSKFAELSEDKQLAITGLLKDRIVKLTDINNFAKFFFETPEIDKNLFGESYKEHLKMAINVIENIKDFDLENLNNKLMDAIKTNNFKTGDFFMTLRIAITGQKFTPPINDSIIILGREETLKRLKSSL